MVCAVWSQQCCKFLETSQKPWERRRYKSKFRVQFDFIWEILFLKLFICPKYFRKFTSGFHCSIEMQQLFIISHSSTTHQLFTIHTLEQVLFFPFHCWVGKLDILLRKLNLARKSENPRQRYIKSHQSAVGHLLIDLRFFTCFHIHYARSDWLTAYYPQQCHHLKRQQIFPSTLPMNWHFIYGMLIRIST